MGKIDNARKLATAFGIFVPCGDHKADIENAKIAVAVHNKMCRATARKAVTMEDFARENPEKAEFFTGKKGREVCRIKTEWRGRPMEWCGLVTDMSRTAPFWIQEREDEK